MDARSLWKRYQDWLYYHEGLGLYLDISRMRFDETFVESMKPKFAQAFEEMKALEAGAVANPDEGRMVGHYWLRNPDIAPTPELKQEILENLSHIEDFAQKVHNGTVHPPNASKFTDILSIGIGGSALGPQFVSTALAPESAPLGIHFIDNTDPAGIDALLNHIKDHLPTTLVLVISKSGTTPDTRNGMIEVQKAFESMNLNFPRHAVAITGHDSALEKQAHQEGWIDTFPMHDWVGGRTSELSGVGLVPAALQGIDIQGMLAGAKEMDEATRQPDLKGNPAALLALSWYFAGNGRGEKDMVVLPYKDSLLLFSRYLQQLVMESLGKEKDLAGNTVYQGIAVYGNKGSTDQHAYVQQLREGVPNFFLTFIEVLEDRQGHSPDVGPGITTGDYLLGFLYGTREAIYDNQRDSISVTIPQVNPRTVGALIALYDRAVGLYASLINVNAYHQPGVEAGKKAASEILDLQTRIMEVIAAEGKPLSLEELAQKADASDRIEMIYKILRHLHANGRQVTLSGNLAQPASLSVSAR
ncbi:glucose-6-phosphate isomerase [Laspinema olomoucense]|uniref:Glucose-6-phosphate isomerase n=1 Tax=Laspinema olomoucense D3b TaxID=2953688 RepID=A0ABT2N2M2_9CYAN|nr:MULTISPECIES: glucose-6-phosphate isomerase [unclassified Laspinema]MCT7970556.1 glucose-6-phosphate isomerase [Laspinema sp. D3d]MCT7976943.1 glucose-6-phosphate isomerase [Laspinema sp. D3b]